MQMFIFGNLEKVLVFSINCCDFSKASSYKRTTFGGNTSPSANIEMFNVCNFVPYMSRRAGKAYIFRIVQLHWVKPCQIRKNNHNF